MKATVAALISAAVIAPAAAQTPTPRVEQRQPSQVLAKADPAKADGSITAKQRAKLAKAKKKQGRKASKDPQKAPKAS